MKEVLLVRVMSGGRLLETRATSNEAVLIGRDPANDIYIDNGSVSRVHAQFVHDGSGYLVQDLCSRNGTSVNGELVEGRIALCDGDVVGVGDFELHIEMHEEFMERVTQDIDRDLIEETIPISKRNPS